MMKHSRTILAALAVALAAPAALHAQGEIAIKAGASFSNVSNKGLLPGSLKDRTGLAAGAAIGYQSGLIGFGIEGLFTQRGLSDTASAGTNELKLDYFDVPAYLRIQLPTPGIKPFAYAGPQVSFELRCRTAGADCGIPGRRKTDFAGVIGGGVKIGEKSGLTIEGRYVYGLTDLKLSTVTSSSSYKTRSFLLLAGYTF